MFLLIFNICLDNYMCNLSLNICMKKVLFVQDFFKKHFEQPIALLRLLHYSAEKSVPEEGVFACGAHSDYGMLTVLATDDVPGLQVGGNVDCLFKFCRIVKEKNSCFLS